MGNTYIWTRRQLRRFEQMGAIWEEHHRRGTTNKWIYEQVIEPQFGVGYSTFMRSLEIPCRRLLAEMEKRQVKVIRTDKRYNVIDCEQ